MKRMTLDEVKKIQLDILVYVADVCHKNNIEYSLAYGTLIGAVRHGGFIPWDDDIDIVLMRKEYKKLLECLSKEKHERYQVLSIKDSGYWYSYAKVTDTRTFIEEKNWPNYEKLGVNIDLFPLDFFPEENPKAFFDESMEINRGLQYCLTDIAYKDRNLFKSYIKRICRYRKVKKCREQDEWYWKHKYEKNVEKTKPSKYIGEIVSGPYNLWDRRVMEAFVQIDFEGEKFQMTKEYDEMLRTTYGNYMELPPEKDRVSNHDYVPYWR